MDRTEFISYINKAKRFVIKIGSSIITENNRINEKSVEYIVRFVRYLMESKKETIIVSSGAVASGMALANFKKVPTEITYKQALASVGQPLLIEIYRKYFSRYNLKISQILITVDDIINRRRFINARNTMINLINWGFIPIVNENDTVVVKELKFGDNDNLSAHILNIVRGDVLIMLTDVDGVFDKNPKESNSAKLIEKVDVLNRNTITTLDGKNELGTGGIKSKLNACMMVSDMGKLAVIINGKSNRDFGNLLTDVNFNKTYFEPSVAPHKSKQSWIENCSSNGTIIIDDGAKESVFKRKSLLASGVIGIKGIFERGDIVNISAKNGISLAKGISNYNSSEVERIKSHKSKDIHSILGYKYSNDVIHTDNMIVFKRKCDG